MNLQPHRLEMIASIVYQQRGKMLLHEEKSLKLLTENKLEARRDARGTINQSSSTQGDVASECSRAPRSHS